MAREKQRKVKAKKRLNGKEKDSSMDGKGDLTKSMHLSFSHTHVYKYLYFS